MAICLRPYWTPRYISTITLLIIYATLFEATPTSVTTATKDSIHKQIDELESAYPDSTLIALGDLSHIDVKLRNYTQQIDCNTHGNNTLDKRYLRHNKSYNCHELAQVLTQTTIIFSCCPNHVKSNHQSLINLRSMLET